MTLFKILSRDFGLFQHWVRTAATVCINTWGNCCGFKEFFVGEMIGDALKSGSPALRIELWAWLTEKLPACKYKKHTVT
jgi:cytoskeleton-associated protein 5